MTNITQSVWVVAVGSSALLGGWLLMASSRPKLHAASLFALCFSVCLLKVRNTFLKVRIRFLELRLEGCDFGFQRGHYLAAGVYLWCRLYVHIFKRVNPSNDPKLSHDDLSQREQNQ